MHFRGGLTVKLLHIVESQIVTFFYHNIDVHFIRYVFTSVRFRAIALYVSVDFLHLSWFRLWLE